MGKAGRTEGYGNDALQAEARLDADAHGYGMGMVLQSQPGNCCLRAYGLRSKAGQWPTTGEGERGRKGKGEGRGGCYCCCCFLFVCLFCFFILLDAKKT